MASLLDRFLDRLEAPAPSPCGGSAAAVSAAMAASLVVMVARGSRSWADGPAVASQAQALRARLTALGEDDTEAFEQVIVARRGDGAPAAREAALAETLIRAAEVPLGIAQAAAEVAELAALAGTSGSRHLRPDATAAGLLAEASIRAAAQLVEVNLAAVPGEGFAERVADLGRATEALGRRDPVRA